MIHDALRAEGVIGREERAVKVYEERPEMKGERRASARAYTPGEDVVRFNRSSKVFQVEAGEYARVAAVDGDKNLLTVTTRSGREVTYNPARLSGVSVYRESECAFSEGERVRFAAPDAAHRVAAGMFGTVERFEEGGGLTVRLDGGRAVGLAADELRHLDYGYAVSDFLQRGCDVRRLIAHVEVGEQDDTISRRMQAVAQGSFVDGARLYTDGADALGGKLERIVERQYANGASLNKASSVVGSEFGTGIEVEGAEQVLSQGLKLGLAL